MDRETAKIAEGFAKRLRRKYDVAKLILFGSRASGENFRDSDFDFLIVSRDFAGLPFTRRMAEVYSFWNHRFALEPLCYTPDEFEEKKKQIGIVRSAVGKGKVIA